MTATESVRSLIDQADRKRILAREAESARVKIRLGARPETRRGLIGFWRKEERLPVQFSAEETTAIYEALADIRDRALRAADEIDARVTIVKERP